MLPSPKHVTRGKVQNEVPATVIKEGVLYSGERALTRGQLSLGSPCWRPLPPSTGGTEGMQAPWTLNPAPRLVPSDRGQALSPF